jgi:ribosome maturation factor RimP
MLSEKSYKLLKSLAEEVSAREGCQLYDLEFVTRGQGRTLRVFIEDPSKGVDIDQCANVSRGLSLLLDVEDLIPGGNYELEVSSPGLERTLREPWHFSAVVGSPIKVRTKESLTADKKAKVKQVTGSLVAVAENEIVVDDQKKEWRIAFDNIHKANLVFEFNKKSKINKR